VVFTDHKPLLGALARVTEPKSDRQRRQLSAIAEFTADIRHIAGQSNVVADTLSRPPPAAAQSYASQLRAQQQCRLPRQRRKRAKRLSPLPLHLQPLHLHPLHLHSWDHQGQARRR
jgi:hypothetical protein